MLHKAFGVFATAVALSAVAIPVQALTPMPPCNRAEGGMRVANAEGFGHYKSGLVAEQYVNLEKDGVIGAAPGPVPALDKFNGMRITECRSGRILALDGASWSAMEQMVATEFLRQKVQAEKPLRLRDAEKAARALFGQDNYVRIIKLRETEETCACRDFFPGMWK